MGTYLLFERFGGFPYAAKLALIVGIWTGKILIVFLGFQKHFQFNFGLIFDNHFHKRETRFVVRCVRNKKQIKLFFFFFDPNRLKR